MPNQFNIYIYVFGLFGILVVYPLVWALSGVPLPGSPFGRRYFITLASILLFGVITYLFRPRRVGHKRGKAGPKAMEILEKLKAGGHINHNHGVVRIRELVQKANLRDLGEEDIDGLYELVPACLLPPYEDDGCEFDWHRFDLCIVVAKRDIGLARRVVTELYEHYPQLRVYMDDEHVIGLQQKLLKRIYYGGSRLCLALISGDTIHDARRNLALNSARQRVKDLSERPRMTGSNSPAYLLPIPLDGPGRSFMEKTKDLAPYVELTPFPILDERELARVIVNNLVKEVKKFRCSPPDPPLPGSRLMTKDSSRSLEITHEVFISYSHSDEAFARRLYDDLQDRGIDCWFAPEHLKIGESIREAIEAALRRHCKVLLILSDNSIRSLWVQSEVELAFEKGRDSGKVILFPVMIDKSIKDAAAAWARTLWRERKIGDFTGWENTEMYHAALERLVLALQSDQGSVEDVTK
jgi:hypothetical protein